jgi:polyisoprenoid-binding protein YceI
MRTANTKTMAGALVFLAGLSLLLSALPAPPPTVIRAPAPAASAAPAPFVLKLDPAHSRVHFTLPSSLHTVHGTFLLASGAFDVDSASGRAGGEIVVNAKSGESGNDSRDSKMHKEILETASYPDVVFHPSQVEGRVANSGPSDVKVRGTLSVHGADHEIAALVHAELSATTWKGSASFDVPYVDWGIKNPSNFFLKAGQVVSIEVEMAGSVESHQPAPQLSRLGH